MPDKFAIGQGVHYLTRSISSRMPVDAYGFVIGVLGNDVRVVSVRSRKPWTRLCEDATGSTDPCKDNVLLTCRDIFPELCDTAYNNDCYAEADVRHMAVIPKSECGIQAGGQIAPREDIKNVMDHMLPRAQPQRDRYQEDVSAARQAAARAPYEPKRLDSVPAPEDADGLSPEERRLRMRIALEEKARRDARRRSMSAPAAKQPDPEPVRTASGERRLPDVSVTPSDPGHGGHGGLGE